MGEKIVQILPHPDFKALDQIGSDQARYYGKRPTRVIIDDVTPPDTASMVFVFGSNEAGIHGAGAARYALHKRGAQWGTGIGMQGSSYGIPTKGGRSRSLTTLPLRSIRNYVAAFLAYARANPDTQFQVTCIGCGLAGLRHEDIAPMFYKAPRNCHFDTLWRPYLHEKTKFWGTF